ncbi:MAG: GntR family transcriptional regulator [Anaerolineae bacterium]
MLKRTPSLTEQAKAHIKQRIINAEFDEGRIPSETTLANELGVSRTTVRDALSRLELEGAVFRKQGAGTFVNEAGLQIKSRLEEIWTYEAMLRAHGYSPSNRIIGVQEQPAGSGIAADLDLAPGESLRVVTKLFLADERPVILTVNHIPADIIGHACAGDDFHQPIYRVLAQFCGQHLSYYLSDIVPLQAPPWLAERLELPPHKTTLLSFDEVGYNQDNRPIIKAYSYFRDDLLRLRLIRRETP